MHYFSGKGCSESLESMHYCIGILKDTEIYKELIQSLIELSFIKVAELKDELTIGQDVLIYDYFY